MKSPIGIYDSGIGGLTVYKEIRKAFPSEDLIYFGDTARVPYGPKSSQTIIEYSIQNTRFLIQAGAKVIVVACNTSSSVAISILKKKFSIPIFGVIEPGAVRAVKFTKNKKIGITGTEGTVNSKAYEKMIESIDPEIKTISRSCPLFVSLVEEGWESHRVATEITRDYLKDFIAFGIDTLVLGCTHYPILKPVIREVLGDKVTLIDSAEAIASNLSDFITSKKVKDGADLFFVSDNEIKFKKLSEKILNTNVINLKKVNLGEMWFIEDREEE